MEIQEFNATIQQIKNDLDNIKNETLSDVNKNKKIEEIKQKAKKTKEDLEKKIATSQDQTKEEAQALLNSLDEIINFKLSIWSETKSEDNETKPEDNESEQKATDSSTTDKSTDKWWPISKIKAWLWEQWNDIRDNDKWEKEKNKNILRTVWFAATWVWLIAIAYTWIKTLFWKEAREARRQKRKAKKAETQKKKEDIKSEVDSLSFWEKPVGKVLKRTWIWTAIVWWYYLLKKHFKKSDESSPESWEETPEQKLWKLRWFESDCKDLKYNAENCLNLSKNPDTDLIQNKQNYDRILTDAINLQDRSWTLADEISKSNADNNIKTEAENLKNRIETYVEWIKAMQDEIYASLEKWDNNWDNNWEWGKDSNQTWNETSEALQPVAASVVSNAAIDYLNKEVSVISLDDNTKSKIKNTLNSYFERYPILKKNKDNIMTLEIWNKTEFSKTIKQLRNDIYSWLSLLKKWGAKLFVGNKLNNIDNTLQNISSEWYKEIVFKYFWWIIKNAVKSENWNMTVQTYYDAISKSYPNKYANNIAKDLASSGQANKDIKDMRYPLKA